MWKALALGLVLAWGGLLVYVGAVEYIDARNERRRRAPSAARW